MRATRTFSLRNGRVAVFVDVFNVYGRENAAYYHYDADYSSGLLRVTRRVEPMLPLLPTIGATWEF